MRYKRPSRRRRSRSRRTGRRKSRRRSRYKNRSKSRRRSRSKRRRRRKSRRRGSRRISRKRSRSRRKSILAASIVSSVLPTILMGITAYPVVKYLVTDKMRNNLREGRKKIRKLNQERRLMKKLADSGEDLVKGKRKGGMLKRFRKATGGKPCKHWPGVFYSLLHYKSPVVEKVDASKLVDEGGGREIVEL